MNPTIPALLALAISHGTRVPQSDVAPVQACVEQIAHTSGPSIPPAVYELPLWSIPVRDICCDEHGNRTTGHAASVYVWQTRTILLSRSAGDQQLAHELYADSIVTASTNRPTPEAVEAGGYYVEKQYRFACDE